MRLKMVTLHDLAWMLCALIIAFGPPSGANAAPSRDPRNYNHGLMREIPQTRRPKIQCGVKGFQHCGEQTYDRLNEMCCNQSVVAKPAPMAECCGKEAIDSEKQLCCGPTKNKKILEKKTSNSQCCHHDQYDPETECCCQDHKTTAVQSNQSDCCVKKREGVKGFQHCGEQTYDRLNEMCCNQSVVAKPAPMAECCGKEAIDSEKQLCCGPIKNKKILEKKTSNSQCCHHDQYDPETECCCQDHEKTLVQSNQSDCCVKKREGVKGFQHCGEQTYDRLNEMCCNQSVVAKPAPMAECCGKEAIDSEKQLCCGPIKNKKILEKKTSNSQCCHYDQYDPETECCCQDHEKTLVQSNQSDCCVKKREGAKPKTPISQPDCTGPESSICGSRCYNPIESCCCEKEQTKPIRLSPPDQTDAVATVYDPNESICCNGRLSRLKPWMDQCCGDEPYGLAQPGVLCCNNTLHKDREDGEQCSVSGHPYNPAKGTMCGSQFHDSPGKHCCGSQLYNPKDEICCNGQSHPSGINIHCCGAQAYNISDPLKKCCAGALHSLQGDRDDSQCCGSSLKSSKEICCKSEGKELLYGTKKGFQCCGQDYYNTSLWSCCSGRLSPVHPTGKTKSNITESRVLSLVNVNKTRLCEKFHIGVVESVSLSSTVFSSVLEIQGGNVRVKHWPSTFILKTPDYCSYLILTPGKTYFFDEVTIFTGFNHDSVLQSIHFILSKCSQ